MFKDRIKGGLKKAKEHARKLKKETMALYLLCKRKDVAWYIKIVPILVVGYALSPIDLIPDFIPVLGYLDDLILVPLGISLAIKLVPPNILNECRVQAEEAFSSGRPQNWIAGVLIIFIWLVIATEIVLKVVRR